MPLIAATASQLLPPMALDAYEGPLDLLLHLIREHKLDISDVPIVQVTDYYLAHLRALEEMNLTVAGEFVVMAATLLEIKSRMLLPKPPRTDSDSEDDGEDPREALIQRLLDYQRYKALVGVLQNWEERRKHLFFRGQADYGNEYELPISFGTASSETLLHAIRRLLDEAEADGSHSVTSVKRQKLTLRLAMLSLLSKVRQAGQEGIELGHCLSRPLVKIEIIMVFLGLLELLRQGKVVASQDHLLGTIVLQMAPSEQSNSAAADVGGDLDA